MTLALNASAPTGRCARRVDLQPNQKLKSAPCVRLPLALQPGDVVEFTHGTGGVRKLGGVRAIRGDGTPVLQWIASTKHRAWSSMPAPVPVARILRRVAPFEALDFARRLDEIAAGGGA